eukprot:gene16612-18301_t
MGLAVTDGVAPRVNDHRPYERALVNWYNFVREECIHKLLALPFVFGGNNPCPLHTICGRVDRLGDPIIRAHIALGSTTYSDGWASYRRLLRYGYQHWVMIHNNNFVDPITGVHVNGVEAYCSRAKRKIKAVYGSRFHLIPSYLDEFMHIGGSDSHSTPLPASQGTKFLSLCESEPCYTLLSASISIP